MTSPEAIQLYGLVATRALAEYDPAELRRATAVSKLELDQRIDELLEAVRRQEDTRTAEDLKERVHQLRDIEGGSTNALSRSFLLRQLSLASMQRAYQLAAELELVGPGQALPRRKIPAVIQHKAPPEKSLVRLAVMRLLRDLPQYTPRFDYKIRNIYVDCFLEPDDQSDPPIVLEWKALRSTRDFVAAIAEIRKVLAGWGRKVVGAIIAGSDVQHAVVPEANREQKVLLLIFDSEANEFRLGDRERLMNAVLNARR
jgi:hypothetical protein